MIVKIIGKTEQELDLAVTLVDKIMDNGTGSVEVHYQLAGQDDLKPWDTGFIHEYDLIMLQALGYEIWLMPPCIRCKNRC